MTGILQKIINRKKEEVAEKSRVISERKLEKQPLFSKQTNSLHAHIIAPGSAGIIAEFKRRSPSAGIINDHSLVTEVTAAYSMYGASGISVLTDEDFFGGSLADLSEALHAGIPVLRKDFIIDAWQVYEAKAAGADAILLIAACLSPAEVKQLAALAKTLQLEILLELHHEAELAHICYDVTMVGVNNRNLADFSVDLDHSAMMSDKIGKDFLKIAESGIKGVDEIKLLKQKGFDGFLIGTMFMKEQDPGDGFRNFMAQLKNQ